MPNSESQSLTVGVLIFDDVEVLDFAGPFEVFSVAGRILSGESNPDKQTPAIHAFTIAQADRIIHARGDLLVHPHFTFENHPPLDVLVVPGGWGTRREIDNPELIDWLQRVTKQTRIKVSVCTGAFLLSRIGLFDGLKATTHWASLDRMALTFPQVNVVRDVRWVDEGNVLSSAGISAGIDVSLYLVGRIFGQDFARATARQMEYNWSE